MISKFARRFFCTQQAQVSVPVVDISKFLSGDKQNKDCKEVAEAFKQYGILVVKDPRVQPQYNEEFLDMMEQFFHKRSQDYYKGLPVQNVHPEYNFQVGATPELKERAKSHSEVIASYTKQDQAYTPQPPPYDQKWRYFWNMSEDLSTQEYPQIIPKDFPQFEFIMNRWGKHMIDAVYTVSQMCALGLGLEENHFKNQLIGGPHLLAPTGSDLQRYDVGTVFAGFHYDFNFLTIHGRSRYPGLFAWKRTGERFTVKVPEGYLLLQSGKQFEKLTGGYITCGFHEVIYTEQTKEVYQQRVQEGKIPWRVSSTLFSHIRGDVILEPQSVFRNESTIQQYPPISAHEHMMQELKEIELAH